MTDTVLPSPHETRHGLPYVDLAAQAQQAGPPLVRNMALARQYGRSFVQPLSGRDVLFVGDLGLAEELADETRFTKAVGPALVNVREFAGDGLFTAFNDEPNWARAHDLLMPAFGLGAMRTYHPTMLRVARRLIRSWDRHAAAGTPVPVADDMTRMTLDTIGLSGFDFDFGSFDGDEPHPFVEAMVRCLEWAMLKLNRRPDVDYSEADEAFRADSGYLASVVDEVIAARGASPAGREQAQDLLGLMLRATHPSDGRTLDAANIRNQVITFLIAGHETTSGTLAFALYFLAKHPAVLQQVQREVDALWGDDPAPEPGYEDIGRLRYTRQVLNETLRLWPAAPGFGRQAREDTVLGGRIPMDAGQFAFVLTPMLHRDPAWGDNPELFDPSRFTAEAEAARSPHAFKPFGTGERACIGRQFALHEATLVLGMLAHRYRLLDHADYRLRIKQTLTIKPEGFTLTLLPRTPADRAAVRAAAPAAASVAVSPAAAPEQGPTDDALPTRVARGTGVLLLHGSNYGTCRDFSQGLAEAAAGIGCDTAVAPLDSVVGALPTDRVLVVTAASYNGRPTDDAAAFVRWLETADAGAADGVTYAVLGVGDRNWSATYQRIPTLIDERLAALGGTRLLDRAAGDASGDLGGAVKAFTARLRTALLGHAGDPDSVGVPAEQSPDTAGYTVTEITGGPLDALAARHRMAPMTVTEARPLTAPGHPRVKQYLRVALPAGTEYRTADHLAVLPANDPLLVERAARVLGVDLDTVLGIASARPRRDGPAVDRPLTVRELLSRQVELQDRPTAEQLRVLAAADPCPPEQKALQALAEDAEARAADRRTLLDVVEDHPALRGALAWPVLLELLPPIRPRTYSISSSPAADPDHAELMVSLLRAPARSGRGAYRGTGSGHLNLLRAGDTVLARVQPCREAFRVDHGVPVVMIAAGTGLAPFRGAVADRRALVGDGAALPPALLYFGCDAPGADQLHAEELLAAQDAGAVSVRPAFSEAPRDGQRFVQHRLAAEADEVWALLEAGAKVYVCGDGRHMAPGVRDAFRAIYRGRTPGADEQAADDWLRALVADGRYVEDVYAG